MASDALTRSSLFYCILACLFFISPAHADQSLVKGSVELPFTYPFKNQLIKTDNELQIKGNNTTDSALILIVRIDNEASQNYYSQFNREFSIQPGPFSITIPITGLKTSDNQPLVQPYTEMIIFVAGKVDGVMIEAAHITQPPAPSNEVLALDFGLVDSPIFPAFELILPEDRRLQGANHPRFRPSGDSLIKDGFEGIKKVSIPWKNGEWKLSLWSEEQGEWEYLPHYLNKKIIVENQTIVDELWTQDSWIKNVYLAGKKQEAVIDGDSWSLVGERRSGLIQTVVHIKDKQLDIVLEGEKSARFLSGLVLEPVDSHFSDRVEKDRKARFLSIWPVESPSYTTPKHLQLTDLTAQPTSNDQKSYLAPRGSLLNLKFQIQSPEADDAPVIAIAPPRSEGGARLDIQKRYGHWRYERPTSNSTSLIVSDSFLRGDFDQLRLSPSLPRNLYLQVSVPKDAEPVVYSGSIQLLSKASLKVVNYQIEVLSVELPEMEKSVGLYLEPAPYYHWFESLKQRRPFATACDLALLAAHGFTNVAPALDSPVNANHRQSFTEQLTQLQRFGFKNPVMAYAPLKRLQIAQPNGKFEKALATLKQELNQQQLPDIYWSIYDEPTSDKFASIKQLAQTLYGQSLEMKTAGHLNNPAQSSLLDVTDLAIMNQGFEVKQTKIRELQQSRIVWLYNMPNPRLAAGYYLWKSGADGYLQWHGRMPTADPFDPTDGREGDVIYLYPWRGSCPAVMDIHSRLLDLHEATIDLRWLQWLDLKAKENSVAKTLREQLKNQISGNWNAEMQSLTTKDLIKIRQKISAISRQIQPSQ